MPWGPWKNVLDKEGIPIFPQRKEREWVPYPWLASQDIIDATPEPERDNTQDESCTCMTHLL